jgi:acetyl esterase/lipase
MSSASAALPLWSDAVPGALGRDAPDLPDLTRWSPSNPPPGGASMLVLPGGGYDHLAPHEGASYAEWLAGLGITSYVLRYRLARHGYRHPCMLQDAARALRWVRHLARREGRDPGKIGIIGSSAGGHLASTLLTWFDGGDPSSDDPVERESSRPDLGVLCYPVISLGVHSHGGSRQNLLGPNPPAGLIHRLSSEEHVTASTPPCFIWHTVEDPAVPVENALLFAGALRRAGVGFELHLFENGGHGLGLGRPDRPAPPWADLCGQWLTRHGFVR